MRFDLADLRLFLAVVEAGSITHGAVAAHLALASASERLRKLEADAGVPLLLRHARGVTTTPAGEALAHHARLILQQQALLRGELHEFAQGTRGTLTLYANTAALTEFLPARLAPWLAARPRLHVDLKERTSAEIVRTVLAGEGLAGLVSDVVRSLATPGLADVQLQPLAPDPLCLIVPATHALANQRALSLAEVLDQPLVGLAGHALQAHVAQQARLLGGTVQWRVQLPGFDGVCRQVAHGVGLAVVPLSVAQRASRRYGVRRVALTDAWARRQLCACFRQWGDLPRPLQDLLAHLGAGPGAMPNPEGDVARAFPAKRGKG